MIAWLALALAADPVATRMVDGRGILVDVGTDSVGVAGDFGPVVIGAHYGYGEHVAVHAGVHRVLLGADRTWGVDGVVAGGLAALVATPRVALTATGEVRAGARTDTHQATLGLVVPLALRLDGPPQAAVPLAVVLRPATRDVPALTPSTRPGAPGVQTRTEGPRSRTRAHAPCGSPTRAP